MKDGYEELSEARGKRRGTGWNVMRWAGSLATHDPRPQPPTLPHPVVHLALFIHSPHSSLARLSRCFPVPYALLSFPFGFRLSSFGSASGTERRRYGEKGRREGRDGKNTENPSRLSILLPWFCCLGFRRLAPPSLPRHPRRYAPLRHSIASSIHYAPQAGVTAERRNATRDGGKEIRVNRRYSRVALGPLAPACGA